MLQNLRIRTRLFMLIGMFVIILTLVGGIVLNQLIAVASSMNLVVEEEVPALMELYSISHYMNRTIIAEKNHILAPKDQIAEFDQNVEEERAQVALYLANLELYMNAEEEKVAFQTLTDSWDNYLKIESRILNLSRQDKVDEAEALSLGDGQIAYGQVRDQLTKLLDDQNTHINNQQAIAAKLAFETAPLLIITIMVSAGVLAIGLSWWLALTITRPLQALQMGVQRVAQGDLQHRIADGTQDELGVIAQSFNGMTVNLESLVNRERERRTYLEKTVNQYVNFVTQVASGDLTSRINLAQQSDESDSDLYQLGGKLNIMVEGLSEMAQQIREVAAGVSAAAAEILAATTQQIASATEQDAAVTQTMTTVEEVRATVRQTAERAAGVADTSRQSVTVSRAGQSSVTDSIDGMKLIRQRVESIAENILMLSERTQQIGEIIETVNEIAAQSKLLALNASIEAARAGEEGKGFAVVAMEVRQLAEQSREATARVRDILNQIQQATNTAVMVTEEGSKGAENGVALVEKAGDSIRDLSVVIENATQAAVQIAASTHQQTNGMDQLAQAMTSIKQATTQTAASTRQAERSAQDLNQMAQQMQRAVARYRLNIAPIEEQASVLSNGLRDGHRYQPISNGSH